MLSMKSAGASGYNIRARLGGASIPVSPMTSQQMVNLLKLVGTPRDGALLRFSLGSEYLKCAEFGPAIAHLNADRKSTRLNSSHLVISYAVFCLKKKKADIPRASHPNMTSQHKLTCCICIRP